MTDFPDLSEIKERRQGLGLTQEQLAEAAGVSQSLIAKVESGYQVPGYETARSIFAALDSHKSQEPTTVADAMTEDVQTLSSDDTVGEAVALAREHAISQFPVAADGSFVGIVTTADLIGLPEDAPVRKARTRSVPTVGPDAPLETVRGLVEYGRAVVVLEEREVVGIVTAEDLI